MATRRKPDAPASEAASSSEAGAGTPEVVKPEPTVSAAQAAETVVGIRICPICMLVKLCSHQYTCAECWRLEYAELQEELIPDLYQADGDPHTLTCDAQWVGERHTRFVQGLLVATKGVRVHAGVLDGWVYAGELAATRFRGLTDGEVSLFPTDSSAIDGLRWAAAEKYAGSLRALNGYELSNAWCPDSEATAEARRALGEARVQLLRKVAAEELMLESMVRLKTIIRDIESTACFQTKKALLPEQDALIKRVDQLGGHLSSDVINALEAYAHHRFSDLEAKAAAELAGQLSADARAT